MKFRHQLIFWILILMIMTLLFGWGDSNYIESFYFVCMLLPVAIGTSWFFNEILVRRFLMKGRYLTFTLYFMYSLVISLWLQMIVVTVSLIILSNYDVEKMNPLATNIQLLAIIIYLVVFLQAFIQMFREMNLSKSEAIALKEEKIKQDSGFLLVRADRKNTQLAFDDILYIESLSDYVRIILCNNGPITTRENISGLEDRLPADFIRIHRSFIIHKKKITSFTKEEVLISDQTLPLSRKYKNQFLESMKPPSSGNN